MCPVWIRRSTLYLLIVSVLLVLSPNVSAAEPTATGYSLPAPTGTALSVSQGNNNEDGSHHNEGAYAFDFTSTPAQFVVTASKAGKVIGVQSDSTIQCKNADNRYLDSGVTQYYPGCWTKANYVLIEHADGFSSLSMHLAPGSVLVKPGDSVVQGQPVGRVGITGWTSGYHLHFQVQETPSEKLRKSGYAGWWYGQSLPIKFSSPEVLKQSRSADGVPKQGQTFTVSGKKGEILPSAGATTRPSSPTPSPTVTKSPSGAPTPTPAPVPTPTKPAPRASSPSSVPRPTPSRSTAPPAPSITIVRLWTQNKDGEDSSSFACLGSTNRVITYRVSLKITVTTTAHVSLIESWGGQPVNKDTTFQYGQNGQVEFYVPSDSPQGKAGTQSYTLIIDYDDMKKRVTAAGTLTTNC